LGKTPINSTNSYLLLKLVLVCLAASLFVFFGTLSFYVRPASDDFWVYHEFKEFGFLGFFEHFPYNLRLTSLSFFGVVSTLSSSFEHFEQLISCYFLALFVILYCVVFHFFKTLFNRINFKIHNTKKHLFSVLFFYGLYFGTSNGIEVWFWFIGSSVYLVATLFFILGVTELLKIGTDKYKPYKSYLFFFLFGGTSENFVLATMVTLLFISIKYSCLRRKFVPVILILLILPLLNLARNSYFNRYLESSRHYKTIGFQLFYPEESAFDFSPKHLFLLLVMMLFFMIAQIGEKQKVADSISDFYKKNKCFFLFLITGFLATSFLPLLLVFNSLGPSRAWMAGNVLLIFNAYPQLSLIRT